MTFAMVSEHETEREFTSGHSTREWRADIHGVHGRMLCPHAAQNGQASPYVRHGHSFDGARMNAWPIRFGRWCLFVHVNFSCAPKIK